MFKAISGDGRDVLDTFLNGGDINVGVPAAMDLKSNLIYRDHRVLDEWNMNLIDRVGLVAGNLHCNLIAHKNKYYELN